MSRPIANSCLALTTILIWAMGTSMLAQNVINNHLIRVGNGMQNSINPSGNMQQPHYHNGTLWRKLTYATLPLNMSFAAGGNGENYWNLNGTRIDDPLMTDHVLDYSAFTYHNGSSGAGYGTVISTGSISLDGKMLATKITYDLLPAKKYIKVTVRVENNSPTITENLRVWVGTRDDWVGQSDEPTKQRGNLINGTFQALPTHATPAAAVRLTSGIEEVLFFTDSPKATSIIQTCCQWTNVINQNPKATPITQTGDGAYGFYVRLNDLETGEGDEFSWYYAVGPVYGLGEITDQLSTGTFGLSNIGCTSAHFDALVVTPGMGYYMVVPQGAAAPTPAQIKAGVNYADVSIVTAGNAAMTADTQWAFPIDSLAHSSLYSLHFVQEGLHPQFAAASSLDFTTADPPHVTITTTASTTCAAVGDGSSTAHATGGVEPYTYLWSSGETEATVNEKSAGHYSVTVHDASGCPQSICEGEITVLDQYPPIAKTKDVILHLDHLGRAMLNAEDLNDGSTDDCGIATFDVSHTFFNCDSDPTDELVTLTVTDLSGNQHSANALVMVSDTIVPIARGRNITLVLNDEGLAFASWEEVEDGSTDNCEIVGYHLSQTAFDCSHLGDNLVTYSVIDKYGNSNSSQVIISVKDLSAPAINCSPQFITCAGIYDINNLLEVTDHCSFRVRQEMGPQLGSYLQSGDYFVQYVATDSSGNAATCSTILQVLESPMVDLGPDRQVHSGETLLISAGSCASCSYNWSTGENTPSISVVADGETSVSVIVSNEAGCESRSAMHISTDAGKEDKTTKAQDGFRLFPNPTADFIKLDFDLDRPLHGAQLTITDVRGRKLYTKVHKSVENGQQLLIDVNNLPSGLYILTMSTEKRVISAKFSKK